MLDIFWDYDIIVTIDMPSLGYYPALGLYSAGQSTPRLAANRDTQTTNIESAVLLNGPHATIENERSYTLSILSRKTKYVSRIFSMYGS